MKKLFVSLVSFLLILALGWMIGTGFMVKTSVYIQDYSVSEDGSELTFTIGIGDSMGFVRGYRDDPDGTAHNLKFYSAWGGLNSALGAKNAYVLPLRPEDTEICVYSGSNGYVCALVRDESTGQWKRA